MEREQLFQSIHKKEFDEIINFLKTGQKAVSDDPIIQQAIGHFFKELIDGEDANTDRDFIFGQLFMLHAHKPPFFAFSNEHFETIVVHLANTAKKPEEANFYASHLPDHPICTEIITKFSASRPQPVQHEQASTIKVNTVLSNNENLSSSIFNSKQERLFYFALRDCYPTHFIYPNMALSTIIPPSIVEDILTQTEKRFFYNTTIDFVVIDQFNDFKPVFAVELDSEWHRLHNQNDKDEIKNKILKTSGLPLYRIEHMSKYKTTEEFQQVIIQTIHTSREQVR